MGAFTDPKFVREFSYRTKINYYTTLRDYSDDPEERRRASKQIYAIHKEMKGREYRISGYYEVTQLINSLIGLLVFPEQVYFENLPQNEDDIQKFFPTLYKLVNDPAFKCTYKSHAHNPDFDSCPNERKTPMSVIKHLRNSISHEHVMIHPLNGRMDKREKELAKIVFEDVCIYKWDHDHWFKDYKDKDLHDYEDASYLKYDHKNNNEKVAVFHLEAPIKELEPLLMEICDFFVK